MTEHQPIFERVNQGAVWVDCSCGWRGGAHASRQTANLAHWAHIDGTPAIPPLKPVVLLAPKFADLIAELETRRAK